MTHSLHRRGSLESLKGDYVVITRPSKVNKAEISCKMAQAAEIMMEVGVSNIGSSVLETNISLGLEKEDFVKRIPTAHALLASFSSKEKLREVLRRLKEADTGLSVTVSGLIDEVIPLAQEMGIKPHTINLSMGILGRTEKLQDEEILEFTTMCGHALIAANLVKKGIEDVHCGAKSARDASMEIAAPCVCGIYNIDRSISMLLARAGK